MKKLNKKQINQLNRLSKSLIKFLNDNFNPHTKIIIEYDGVEIVQGLAYRPVKDFIKD